MKRFMMTLTTITMGLAVSGTALAGGKGPGKPSNQGKASAQNIQVQGLNQSNGIGSNALVNKKLGNLQPVAINQQGGGSQGTQNVLNGQANLLKKTVVQQNQGQVQKVQKGQKKLKTINDYHGFCYFGHGIQFWTHCYFDDRYGCELYFCPVRTCWFFWYQPWDCYLPCDVWVDVCGC